LSGQFVTQSLFAAVDEILGAIFASRTQRNVMNQSKYGQIINCGLTILIVSLFSLCRLRNTTRLRSGTVDKSKWPVFLQTASGNPTQQPGWYLESRKQCYIKSICAVSSQSLRYE